MNNRYFKFAAIGTLGLMLSMALMQPLAYATENSAPVLDSSKSPALSSVTEDPGAPSGAVGTLVSSLVDFATPTGQVDNVTDSDVGALLGIAITAVDTTNVTCYYTLNGGSTWTSTGAVSSSSARLLSDSSSNRIYCQPGADINGTIASAITFVAWDQTTGVDGGTGDASTGGGTTAFSSTSDTVSLVVTAVNDAPAGTNLSAAEAYTEDTALNLTDIVASDVDSATLTATLTFSSPAVGSLSTATSGAVTSIYNAGTGVWSASGATADVNTLLAGVTFTPASNVNSSFTLATSISDGITSTAGSKAFTGVAVNDAPAGTNLSAAEAYTEDTALNLVNIVASDIDSSTVIVTLILSNASAGTLSTGTSGAVTSTFDSETGFWIAGGATADVNTLLEGVTFTPSANFNSSFTMSTRISDGALSVTGSKAFTGTPVNDAPAGTNLSAGEAYTEDTALNLTDIVASDVDSATLTATLTLSSAAVGSLNTATSGAVTSTYMAGVWSASGATADVNTLLAGVTFTPASNVNSNFTVATSISDGILSVTGSKAFTGVAVNDAPAGTNLSAAESYTEDTALNLTDIVASDVDSATLTAILTLSDPNVGTLSTATSGAVTSTYMAGVWSASGATADVNTLLAGVTFTPNSNENGSFTLATSISDGALSVTGSKAFTGTAVNDAPEVDNLSAAETYTEDGEMAITDIVVTDPDDGDVIAVTLTLSDVDIGSLTTTTVGSTTSTYTAGTGVWSASGPLGEVNVLLDDVAFIPTANLSGNFSIATSVSDGIAPAVTGLKEVTGTAVNDAPVLDNTVSLTLSTIAEDAGAPSGTVGTLVSDWLSGGNVSDVDSGAVTGIAITAVDSNLTCYYSLDDGATWSAMGAISGASSRLFTSSATNRIYCQAAANANGVITTAVTLRAWDQTSGSNGALASTSSNGGITAFSTATDSASLTVTAVNDDPIATDDTYDVPKNASAADLFVLTNDDDADEDTMTITAVTATDNGGTASIEGDDAIRYQSATGFAGTETFTYTVSDGNGGSDTATVTITILDTVKAITDFSITSSSSVTIDEGGHTIAVTMPYGTDATALTPTITMTGESVSPNSGVAQDFTNPVTYTVTAEDGSTQDYVVTVTVSARTRSSGGGGGGGGVGFTSNNNDEEEESADASSSTSSASTEDQQMSGGVDFTDTDGHWAEDYITDLSEQCGIQGYKDARGNVLHLFGPNDGLLRAELVQIVVKCQFPDLEAPNQKPFNDVGLSTWYAPAIAKAKAMGWIQGYEDGSFRPLDRITRAEALKIILLSQFSESEIPDATPHFTDTPAVSGETPWYYKYVAFAVEQGIISGYTDTNGQATGFFGPNDFMLRGQAAKVIMRSL